MIKATYTDKPLIVDILTQSFADNKSVNYIVKQDNKKIQRLGRLMEYSFDYCYWFGQILLSDDKQACALIIFPDKKRTTLKSIIADLKLITSCMGIANLKKAMQREKTIKQKHPDTLFTYLWFIGVKPENQNKGAGTALLHEIITASKKDNRPVLLETSVERNLPWYKNNGFEAYAELDFGYKLYCMKHE